MARIADSAPALDRPSLVGEAEPVSPRPASPKRGAIIAWTLVACAAMACSGVVRAIQERRFAVEKQYLESCPFPLASLPTAIGDWRMIEGGEKSLDSLTLRITGAPEHLLRVYVDELTGVTLSVLILFGPAEPVLPHTPQVCYPASGFIPTEEASIRFVKGTNGKTYPFRSGVFAKSGGRAMLREVSYYSFRLEGPWGPDVAAGRRFPRKNPGIFKIQIQRRVADGERRDQDDPIEHFIAQLLPEIDRRVDESQVGPAKVVKMPKAESKDAAPAGSTR